MSEIFKCILPVVRYDLSEIFKCILPIVRYDLRLSEIFKCILPIVRYDLSEIFKCILPIVIYDLSEIFNYITNLVCYTYFHWLFNPECQHIFGKQTGYIYTFSVSLIWAPKNNNNVVDKNRHIYASLNQYHNTE